MIINQVVLLFTPEEAVVNTLGVQLLYFKEATIKITKTQVIYVFVKNINILHNFDLFCVNILARIEEKFKCTKPVKYKIKVVNIHISGSLKDKILTDIIDKCQEIGFRLEISEIDSGVHIFHQILEKDLVNLGNSPKLRIISSISKSILQINSKSSAFTLILCGDSIFCDFENFRNILNSLT